VIRISASLIQLIVGTVNAQQMPTVLPQSPVVLNGDIVEMIPNIVTNGKYTKIGV